MWSQVSVGSKSGPSIGARTRARVEVKVRPRPLGRTTGETRTIVNLRAETTTNTETSTCKHEDQRSDSALDHFVVMFWSCVELAHFASSLIALVFFGAQDAWLAMQVLATEAFGVRQSHSKEALVRQWVVGWVGAASSQLGQDACWVRRT